MSKKSWPILYNELLYKMSQDVVGIQYIWIKNKEILFVGAKSLIQMERERVSEACIFHKKIIFNFGNVSLKAYKS